jgi:tRNA1(Val) A37 N6-methylase TrmN6
MSRFANAEKAGYFKIPASVTDLLVTHMTAPQGGRILDPCAGEGTALVTFAEKLGLDPCGVELHEGRAEAAREVVNQLIASHATADEHTTGILHDSYLNLITSQGGYNLLYCNPP